MSIPQAEANEDGAASGLAGPTGSALFIPLKREYFEAFERGEKEFEYREYGPRWNERTCRIGRPVVLSMGYGKARRLRGVVNFFDTSATPSLLPGWSACYGDNHRTAAIIGVKLNVKAQTRAEDQL